MSRWLGRLAADAPVPIFTVAGLGAREAVQDLRLRRELRLLDAPGGASILLVAGAIPEDLAPYVSRVHDGMAHPRATVVWSGGDDWARAVAGSIEPVTVSDDPALAVVGAYRDLVRGRRDSEPAILPDADPAPWRGVGPYGQGGSGMTGGVPYGRPMAELGPDPDGLRLDVLPVRIGPFFPRFPAGLLVDARLAGDLVLDATVRNLAVAPHGSTARPGLVPFLRALDEPVSIAELELARATDHLRWLSDALAAHGLRSLAARALSVAAHLRPGQAAGVGSLGRLVASSQVMRWSTRRVGRIAADQLVGLGLGPVARAAGLAEDVRLEDPGYRELGFRPIVDAEGDAAARMRVRLAEIVQSLGLAARAGDRTTAAIGRVESPRGRLEAGGAASERLLALVPAALREIEWGDAVATLVSLDLDLEEADRARRIDRPAAAT